MHLSACFWPCEYGKETDGAFDVTVGSLVDCLLTQDKALKMPAETEVRAARKQRTGMHHLALNQEAYTVKVHDVVPADRPGCDRQRIRR